jgi:serine/threonine-protein kinase
MPHGARTVTLPAVLAALFLAGAAPAQAQGIHAALALSPSTGAYGYGYNYDTVQGARDRAMMECRKHAQDCRVYSTFSRACIAVARASNNAFGWAIGYPEDERPERALNECAYRNGDDCKVVVKFCSGVAGR